MKTIALVLEDGNVSVSFGSHHQGSGKTYLHLDRGKDKEPATIEMSNLEFWNLYEVMTAIVQIVNDYDMHSGKADLPLSPCHQEISTDVPF